MEEFSKFNFLTSCLRAFVPSCFNTNLTLFETQSHEDTEAQRKTKKEFQIDKLCVFVPS
jgi:hypothetical protein